MKQKPTIALLGAAFALAVGIMGFNGVISMPFTAAQQAPTSLSDHVSGPLGHVTLVVKDPAGNIKAYRQLDNVVVTLGKSCTASALFSGPNQNIAGNCNVNGPFKYIALGSGANQGLLTDTQLVSEFTRLPAAVTVNNASSSPAAVANAVLTKTFTFSGTTQVQEAGVFDTSAESSGHLFSERTTGTINLGSGDQLTVTWTISTG